MQTIKTHRNTIILSLFVLILATFASRFVLTTKSDEHQSHEPTVRSVTLATPFSLQTGTQFDTVGTVVAASEGLVTSEVGGRINRINVREGQQVAVGSVIIELNNTQQRAAVAQAEAALRSAQAGGEDGLISTREAENNLARAKGDVRNAITVTFSSIQRTLVQDIDPLFSRPNQGIPGVRIGSGNIIQQLNDERVSYRTLIPDWQASIRDIENADASELENVINEAKTIVARTKNFFDLIITAYQAERTPDQAARNAQQEQIAFYTRRRDEMVSLQTNLNTARNGLQSAEEMLNRTALGRADTELSRTAAEISRAEAALIAARASLNDTLLRASLSGTIVSLPVTLGQFVSPGTTVAEIANQSALEVETFVSSQERARLSVGDTTAINDMYTARISAIAPTLDTTTGKINITMTVSDTNLTIGDTVRVSFTDEATYTDDTTLRVPLTAVVFRGNDGFVMMVDEEKKLKTVPVTLGATRGQFIEIIDGIDNNTKIVIDVRGLRVGQMVTIRE